MRNAAMHSDLNHVRRSLREAYKHVALALERTSKTKAAGPEVQPLGSTLNLTKRLKRLEVKLIEEIEALELSYSARG